MAGKKLSATKKTAQEIREMIACLESSAEWLELLEMLLKNRAQREDIDILIARINKLIGEPK